ncbi:MAG: nuclear transport factor 2 family protein [Flavobacteriales bacterium]|nr:nuclear transport factor 2 family protein [Flavobacteriales bacterium]
MSLKDKISEMYGMVGQGQSLEAFEKFYHDDVKMIECTGEVREGKEANREFQKNWYSQVDQVHDGGVRAVTADDEAGVTMVETWTDMSFKDGNRMKMEEVARQKWKDGKIIEERFYYDTRGMEPQS